MIVAADTLPRDAPIEADIAIVGAGAVGVALATRLADRGRRIALIEAGGLRYDPDQQTIFFKAHEIADRRYPPTELYRRRMLGGTTSVWGGRCIPLDPDDFMPAAGRCGWPIAYDEIAARMPDALEFFDAGRPDFNASTALRDSDGFPCDMPDADVVCDRIERWSPPTDVWKKSERALAKADNVLVVHSAACTEILTTPDGNRATGLRLNGASSDSREVRSPIVVLACGGLEAPRLLLASRSVRSCGLGNEHDLVGRFYMTHLVGDVGHLRLAVGAGPAFDYTMANDGVYVRRLMLLSPAARRREGLCNIVFRPTIRSIEDPAHGDAVLSAMFLAKRFIIAEYARRLVAEGKPHGVAMLLRHCSNVMLGLPQLTRFGTDWMRRRTFATRKLPSVFLLRSDRYYPMEFNAEQSPDFESRVLLGPDVDPYGTPRLIVRWRATDDDLRLVARAFELFRTAVGKTGLGEMVLEADVFQQVREAVIPQAGHHIGAVRMGADAGTSVLDRNCEAWGTKGLFVAGPAVFPTSGFANPTLTAVAAAFRLADHLTQQPARSLGEAG